MSFVLRRLAEDDLPEMDRLERKAWPEDVRASLEKMRDRLQTFGEGFFGVYVEERLLGMASSQIMKYSDERSLVPWVVLTADGWISRTHRRDGNCLHFVSVCVRPDARHLGVASLLNQARVGLAEELGLEWALTDTRVPSLGRYLAQRASATPDQYLKDVLSGAVSEPVVNMYLKLGFQVLGLIPNCMRSDVESAGYGLSMVKRIETSESAE